MTVYSIVIRYYIEVWDDGGRKWSPVLDAPMKRKTDYRIEIFQLRPLTRAQADRRIASLRKRLPVLTFRVTTKEV